MRTTAQQFGIKYVLPNCDLEGYDNTNAIPVAFHWQGTKIPTPYGCIYDNLGELYNIGLHETLLFYENNIIYHITI